MKSVAPGQASRTPHPEQSPGPALPQISEAEWVVMKVVWDKAPVTANEVVESLKTKTSWKPKTIHTLLSRLVQKGAVAFEKRGREHLFKPLVDAQSCVRNASRSFLQRFFDGEVAPFLACLIESEQLSRADLEELRGILNRKKS